MWNRCLLVSFACSLVTKILWGAVSHWWMQTELKLPSMLMGVCSLPASRSFLLHWRVLRTLSSLHCMSVERISVRESKVLYLCFLLCKFTFVLINSHVYCSGPILLSSIIKVFLRYACINLTTEIGNGWWISRDN